MVTWLKKRLCLYSHKFPFEGIVIQYKIDTDGTAKQASRLHGNHNHKFMV